MKFYFILTHRLSAILTRIQINKSFLRSIIKNTYFHSFAVSLSLSFGFPACSSHFFCSFTIIHVLSLSLVLSFFHSLTHSLSLSLSLTGHEHRPSKSSFPQVQLLNHAGRSPRLVIRHTCITGTFRQTSALAHSSATSTCTPHHPLSADIRQTGIYFLDHLGLCSTCRYSNTVARAGTRADSSPHHRHRFETHAHPSTRIRTIQSCCLCIVFDSSLVKSNCTTVQPWGDL